MADGTAIEWTDATWNPVRGCTRVSEGCRNCYAERVAARFSGPGMPYEGLAVMSPSGPRWTHQVRLVPEHLEDPLRWRKPRRIFVNSMSDLFHEGLSDNDILSVFSVMENARHRGHTFQVLTKRADRMRDWVTKHAEWVDYASGEGEYLRRYGHVWLGVSVEDQKAADQRIPPLIETLAAVRFLSCEPLLGPVELAGPVWQGRRNGLEALGVPSLPAAELAATFKRLDGLHWVIAGGESGPGARPMHPGWVRSLRDECQAAGVPFFFKQWGDWSGGEFDRRKGKMICSFGEAGGRIFWTNPGAPPVHLWDEKDHYWTNASARLGKKLAGRTLDGRTWDEFPEVATQ